MSELTCQADENYLAWCWLHFRRSVRDFGILHPHKVRQHEYTAIMVVKIGMNTPDMGDGTDRDSGVAGRHAESKLTLSVR